MEFFIKVMFWLLLFGAGIRFLAFCVVSYPRKHSHTREEDMAAISIKIFFIIWTYRLIY